MTSYKEAVEEFLAQEHIAVTGLSREVRGSADSIYKRLRETGHQVYAVHPERETFEGDPCYPDLKSLPESVGGVVIVNRPEIVEEIVRECAEAGISRVWIHQSMRFMGGSYSEAAVTYCREHGIKVIPGGCPMMFAGNVDFGHKIMRWWCGRSGVIPEEI